MSLLFGLGFEVVGNMDGEDREAFVLDEGTFVVAESFEEFFLVIDGKLFGRFAGDKGEEGNYPKGEFFVLNLEQEQLNQIGFDDVVVGEYHFDFGVVRHVVTDELDQVLD